MGNSSLLLLPTAQGTRTPSHKLWEKRNERHQQNLDKKLTPAMRKLHLLMDQDNQYMRNFFLNDVDAMRKIKGLSSEIILKDQLRNKK